MLRLRSVQRLAGRAAPVLPPPLQSAALCPPLPDAAVAALSLRRFGWSSCGCAISPLQQRAASAIGARHFSSGSSGPTDSAAAVSPAVSGGGDSVINLQSQRRLTSQLVQLAKQGDSATAERLVAEAEAAGLQPDVRAVTAWLGCYMFPGGWRGAEAAWQRLVQHSLVPDSVSYRSLMQVYTADGSAEQLAKIAPLYKEMRRGSGPAGAPLQFSARDYENLIKTAHRYRLASQARRWATHATTAGVSSQLDGACYKILANISEWGKQPQLTAQQRALSARHPELPASAAAATNALTPVAQTSAGNGASGAGVDVKIATAWLSGYVRNGDCRSAEKVWQRLANLRIAPDSVAYRTRMQVCMANGSADQLAVVEQLYREMSSGSGPARKPLHLSEGDYAHLIETAYRWRLDEQVLRWCERAKAAGVWPKIGGKCRKIFAAVSGQPLPVEAPKPPVASVAKADRKAGTQPSAKAASAAASESGSELHALQPKENRETNTEDQSQPKPSAADVSVTPAEPAPVPTPAESAPDGQHTIDDTATATTSNKPEQPAVGVTPPATDISVESAAAAATAVPSTQPASKSRSKKEKNAEPESDAQQLPAASESTSTISADSAAPPTAPSAVPTPAAAAPLTAAALSALTVVQLRALLKERGLKVSGVKSELVDRLVNASAAAQA